MKVSVVLPTYNSLQTVPATIRSVFNQHGAGREFEIELIVVDDGSTDGTVSFLRGMGITCLSTGRNSGGPNKGRNMALREATGDYICFIDHDDIWHPDKILTQLSVVHLAPIVTTRYSVMNRDTGKIQHRVNSGMDPYTFYPLNKSFRNKLSRKHNGQHLYLSTMMIHSDLKDILFEEIYNMVDFDWTLRLLHNQCSVEVNKSLVTREVHGRNLSLNEVFRQNDFRISMEAVEQFKNEYPREARIFYRRIHGSMARYHYLQGDMKKSREYLKKSGWGWKEMLYLLTSYYGSSVVKRYFPVFG